jgi:uncharacterized protein (UPF0210 family)
MIGADDIRIPLQICRERLDIISGMVDMVLEGNLTVERLSAMAVLVRDGLDSALTDIQNAEDTCRRMVGDPGKECAA